MFGGLKSNCCRGKTRQKTEEERGKRRRRRRQAFHSSSSSPSSLPPPSVVEKQQPLLAPLIWTMEGLASVINFNWRSASTREMTPECLLFCRVHGPNKRPLGGAPCFPSPSSFSAKWHYQQQVSAPPSLPRSHSVYVVSPSPV